MSRFKELKREIITGFVENIRINKQVFQMYKGHPVLRRFAVEAIENIKNDQESMITFSKIHPNETNPTIRPEREPADGPVLTRTVLGR